MQSEHAIGVNSSQGHGIMHVHLFACVPFSELLPCVYPSGLAGVSPSTESCLALELTC
jgi:hypothetical protein